MPFYGYLVHFLAGCFLANGVPHFVYGISGEKFQSPFASPPGKGLSSPLVNVIWGFANFVVGYLLLLTFTQEGEARSYADLGAIAAGVFLMGVMLATHFGRVRAGR
ncbi:MAG TPA: hypothetical protein VLW75_04370 [Rhizomicrobium sp.]|nr:hypothetical protein [Rhizomicrobium sp.]